MTNPVHHVPDDLLAGYAAGHLERAASLLVAAHGTLCPRCRDRIDAYEAVGGALLDDLLPTAVSSDVLGATLARLDEPEPPAPIHAEGVLPRPILALTGPLEAVAWRRGPPGIRFVDLPVKSGDMPVRLFELRPGTVIPDHDHTGTERSLVLTGGFTDDAGHYGRGDVCWRGTDRPHRAVVDPGEVCHALLVSDGPIAPHAFLARLVARLVSL